ncbi:MAG: VanZ family protein [Terracidiphilus sp.]|nr:VanZ family protein [Terracidiphilus sp.]
MWSKSRRAAFWIYTWWPVALAIGIIMLESTEMLGADHTSGPLRHFFETLLGRIRDETWEIVHHIIRKTGHFVGYGLVGFTWFRAWWRTLPSSSFLRCFVLSVLGTFLIAGADEWHQSFLPNRGGKFSDVLLDCSGAVALLSVTYLVLRVFHYRGLLLRKAASRSRG